jgi:hypothetical protein
MRFLAFFTVLLAALLAGATTLALFYGICYGFQHGWDLPLKWFPLALLAWLAVYLLWSLAISFQDRAIGKEE